MRSAASNNMEFVMHSYSTYQWIGYPMSSRGEDEIKSNLDLDRGEGCFFIYIRALQRFPSGQAKA